MAMPMCLWTKRSAAWWWTFPVGPGLEMHVPFKSGMIGHVRFTQLAFEFFQGFVNHAYGHFAY